MSQGLFADDDRDKNDNENDDENEGMPAGPVRAVDRKTKQQRRKEKEQLQEASGKWALQASRKQKGPFSLKWHHTAVTNKSCNLWLT